MKPTQTNDNDSDQSFALALPVGIAVGAGASGARSKNLSASTQTLVTVARRSAAGAPSEAEIWLGDSLGEMALYYAGGLLKPTPPNAPDLSSRKKMARRSW